MSIKEIAGSNVRGFRKIIGLSQVKFAEIAGLNRSYIASVERGEVNLTIESLERIATIIGVPPHVLLIEKSFQWAVVKDRI